MALAVYPPVLHSRLLRYGIAVGSVALAAGVRLALRQTLGPFQPFLTFIPAVLVAAWFGGLGATLVTLGLGSVAAFFCAVPPDARIEGWSVTNHAIIQMVWYFIIGMAAALTCETLRGPRGRSRLAGDSALDAAPDDGCAGLEFALRQQRERWHVTLSRVSDAVIVTDVRGHVTALNPAAERLIGWSEHEVAGQPVEQVFAREPTGTAAADRVTQALREGTEVRADAPEVWVGNDGRRKRVEASAAPLRGADGQVTGAVLILREQAHLGLRLRRLRALVWRRDGEPS